MFSSVILRTPLGDTFNSVSGLRIWVSPFVRRPSFDAGSSSMYVSPFEVPYGVTRARIAFPVVIPYKPGVVIL